jgi:hypothetical protein
MVEPPPSGLFCTHLEEPGEEHKQHLRTPFQGLLVPVAAVAHHHLSTAQSQRAKVSFPLETTAAPETEAQPRMLNVQVVAAALAQSVETQAAPMAATGGMV